MRSDAVLLIYFGKSRSVRSVAPQRRNCTHSAEQSTCGREAIVTRRKAFSDWLVQEFKKIGSVNVAEKTQQPVPGLCGFFGAAFIRSW